MKKIISIFISIICLFCLFNFGACSNSDDKGLKIVCTIFPEYDWVRELTKGNEDISNKMLLDSGIDLHSYQPSVEDIASISACDLFIYVGGESDEWVENALKNAKNKNRKVINLLETLDERVKEEEIVEGMEVEEEDEEGEETEYDEHVWLSLKNAVLVCEAITDTLIEINAENETLYQQNLLNYKQKLNELDALYTTAVSEGTKDTVLFGDRFPFRYLVDDYGLKYYAAFVGCSAESEASFETIVFLAQKIDELSLTAILTLEEANHNIAQTIKNNTTLKNQKIYVMDSMQSVTKTKISSGITYLSIMEQNLNSLKEALK